MTDAGTVAPTPRERSRGRRFGAGQKLAIVLETEPPGMAVGQVVRDHRIVPSMIFRRRAKLGFGKNKPARLTAVWVADTRSGCQRDDPSKAVVPPDLLPVPDGLVALDLPDGRRAFAPAGSDPEAIRRHVAERGARP